jgi:hypothetical protein
VGNAAIVQPPPGNPDTRELALQLLRAALRGEAPSLGPWLLVVAGPDRPARLALSGVHVLGRGETSDLRLSDPCLSRRHARISVSGAEVRVEDLGGRNGTRVNGRRLRPGAHALRPGDEVAAGATRLVLGAAGLDPAAPPAPRSDRGALLPLATAALLGASALALALAAL